MKNTKKLVTMAISVSLALILSFIESQIPAFVAVPGVKLGLANIAVVFALYKLGEGEAAIISAIRANHAFAPFTVRPKRSVATSARIAAA